MKQWKKVLTGCLTAATVLSMAAVPAQADDTVNPIVHKDGSAITALNFTKYYETTSEEGYLSDATFTFTMEPAAPETDSKGNVTEKYAGLDLAVTKGVDLEEQGKLTFDLSMTSATGEIGDGGELTEDGEDFTWTYSYEDGGELDAKFNLDYIYDAIEDMKDVTATVYKYTVKEEIPEEYEEALEYDDTEYTVYVVVDNEGNIANIVNASGTKEKEPITFTNFCKTGDLTVTKKVEGNAASSTEPFPFNINIPVEGDAHSLPAGQEIAYTITRGKNTIKSDSFKVGATDNDFELVAGDKLTITGLPIGTIYTITEDADATKAYQTSITIDRSGIEEKTYTVTPAAGETSVKVFNASAEKHPIATGANTVTYTNGKSYTATGIALDVAPYLAVILLVAAGAVVVAVSKKRTQR
jgi:hypothetical protein